MGHGAATSLSRQIQWECLGQAGPAQGSTHPPPDFEFCFPLPSEGGVVELKAQYQQMVSICSH